MSADPETTGSHPARPADGLPPPDEAVAQELRALTEEVVSLRAEIESLRARPALPEVEELDDPTPSEPGTTPSHAWVGSLEQPVRRTPRVPRLLIEGVFLVAAAALAALADLEPVWIAAVMAGAWLIVVLAELAAAAAERRRAARYAAVPQPPQPVAPDAAWLSPPVDRTLHDVGRRTGKPADTLVAGLPRADAEATIEHAAPTPADVDATQA